MIICSKRKKKKKKKIYIYIYIGDQKQCGSVFTNEEWKKKTKIQKKKKTILYFSYTHLGNENDNSRLQVFCVLDVSIPLQSFWQLYLNFIVLNLIFSLDQENKWKQVKLENYNALPY